VQQTVAKALDVKGIETFDPLGITNHEQRLGGRMAIVDFNQQINRSLILYYGTSTTVELN